MLKHKKNLENRLNRRQQIIKGKGLPLVKHEQDAKTKSKPKKEESGKQKPSQLSVVSVQQDSDLTPPQTPVKMPGNRDEERTHYWSLRDIPKFEGKGEQPFSHLMEFEDYLIASGVRMEPDEDEDGRRIDVDYRDIINKFKASLKDNARVWYSMYIDGRITDLYSEAGWKTIKSRFLTYFNPIGSTKEQQIKAWKELK